MKRRMLWLMGAILAASAAGSTHAQVRSLPFRLAHSGVPLKVASVSSINPDCSSRGYGEVRLLTQPRGGQVTTVRMRDYPSLPASDPGFACDRRRVPGVNVFYRSFPGFRGADEVNVELIFPDGVVRTAHYAIQVE